MVLSPQICYVWKVQSLLMWKLVVHDATTVLQWIIITLHSRNFSQSYLILLRDQEFCHSVYECALPAGVVTFQTTVQHDRHEITSSEVSNISCVTVLKCFHSKSWVLLSGSWRRIYGITPGISITTNVRCSILSSKWFHLFFFPYISLGPI